MKKCPQCRTEVLANAWICPFCEFILDASVLEDSDDNETGAIPSTTWDSYDGAPEALILGDVSVDPEDFQLQAGAGADKEGRTTTFLFYTTGATSRIVRPDAVPKVSEATLTRQSPTTPYEDFILNLIDGRRSVRTIQRESGLSPQEVMISLLTLIDKRIVEIEGNAAKPRPAEAAPSEEPTVARTPSGRRSRSQPLVVPAELDPDDQDETTEHSPEEELSSEYLRDRTVAEQAPHRGHSRAREVTTGAHDVDDDMLIEPSEVSAEALSAPAGLAISRARSDTELSPDDELEPFFGEDADRPGEDFQDLVGPPAGIEAMPTPAGPPVDLLSEAPEMVIPSEVDDEDASQVAVVAVRADLGRHQTPASADDTDAKARRMRAVAIAVERERHSHDPEPEPDASPRPSEPPPRAETPIAPERMAKAQKLYEQALRDKAGGNLLSAKMNMKLALTFDPANSAIQRALAEVSKSNPENASSRARLLYDKATTAERLGNVDEAIELLEQAIKESKEGAYYNRLGVLLATKKQKFIRAQEMIEEALQRSPGNPTYENNRGKILQLAAKADIEAREEKDRKPKKRGLLGLLGKRK